MDLFFSNSNTDIHHKTTGEKPERRQRKIKECWIDDNVKVVRTAVLLKPIH